MILRYFKWWAQSSAARTGEHFNVNLSAPVAHEKALSPASWHIMTHHDDDDDDDDDDDEDEDEDDDDDEDDEDEDEDEE